MKANTICHDADDSKIIGTIFETQKNIIIKNNVDIFAKSNDVIIDTEKTLPTTGLQYLRIGWKCVPEEVSLDEIFLLTWAT
jgi:adenylate kinase